MSASRNFRLALTLSALALAGCSSLRTDKRHHAAVDALVSRGDFAGALAKTEAAKNRAYTHKDRVVYYLDRGLLLHWNRQYAESNEMLQQAERAIEETFTKSITRAGTSMLLNDNALEYPGEPYEDVYLNLFKALNFLALGAPDKAFVEIRRIDLKIARLERRHEKLATALSDAEETPIQIQSGPVQFDESALGRFLGILLYRHEGRWDDVRIDQEKIERGWQRQPDIHPFTRPDLTGIAAPTQPGTARLALIAFTGRIPDKTAKTFYLHTEENLIVVAGSSENYLGHQNLAFLEGIPWPSVKAGYHFKLQLPEMHPRPSAVARIEATLNDRAPEPLQRIESLEAVARETFRAKKPLIFTKTLTRSITKGLAAEQAKENLTDNMDSGVALLVRLATDLTIDLTENADLRIGRYFPAEAFVGEIQAEEGTYDLRIRYYTGDGRLLHTDERIGIQLEPGQLHVLESAYLN